MPSISELFIPEINKQNLEKPSDAGWQVGAELAKMQQDKQQQAAMLKQKMQELQNAKYEKLYSYIGDAKNYMNAGDRNRYLQTAVGYRNALGISPNDVPDEQIKGLGSDENMGRVAALQAEVRSGKMSPKEAGEIMANAQKFGQIVPLTPQSIQINKLDWSDAQEDFLKRQNAIRVAEISSQTQLQKQATEIATTGDQEAAKKANDLYVANQGGGVTAAKDAAIELANETIRKLENGELKTGNWIKKGASLAPNSVGDLVDSAVKTQNAKILQNVNMRLATGDSNPADNRVKEIERRMSVDISLSPKQNIDKIKSGLKKTLSDYDNTDKLFRKYVRGYNVSRDWSKVDENQRRAYLQEHPNGPDAAAIRKSLGE